MLRCIKDLQYEDKIVEKGRLYKIINQDQYYVYVDGVDYSFSYDEMKEYFQEISKEEIREMKKAYLMCWLCANINFIAFKGENPDTYEDRIERLADLLIDSIRDDIMFDKEKSL